MKHLLILSLMLCICISSRSQEEHAIAIQQGKRYLDINLKQLSSLNNKTDKVQARLLKRLKKKERKFATKLKRKDSASYARYQQQPGSFDSISHIEKDKLNVSAVKVPRIDSLNAVNKFISSKQGVQVDKTKSTDKYGTQLTAAKDKLAQNQQVNNLIDQRLNFLKSLNANPKHNVKGLQGIDKQVFYGKSRMQVLKEISDEPSKLEEKSLEYLQGEEGFDKIFQNASGNNSNPLAGKSVDELERMGYQTKRKVTAQLQSKLGSGLSTVQQNMAGQVKDYSDKFKELKSVQNTVKQTKQSAGQFKNIDKPAFKVNPMKGKPFTQRIEKQFNWQANRATLDGKPATLQLSGMAGFRQTPKLSYGLGIALLTGLGQNWSHVKISFEGLGLRSYVAWQWQYGIGAYGGYERTYKQAAFTDQQKEITISQYNIHNSRNYSDAVLMGLTKSYRISDKLNGSIQVLYDIWWKEKGLKNPILLRFATIKN